MANKLKWVYWQNHSLTKVVVPDDVTNGIVKNVWLKTWKGFLWTVFLARLNKLCNGSNLGRPWFTELEGVINIGSGSILPPRALSGRIHRETGETFHKKVF